MKTIRNYKGKNVDMLMVCSTIVEHAIANKETLIEKRPLWVDPYFSDLQARIASAFPNIIGVNSIESMKSASVAGLQTTGKNLQNTVISFRAAVLKYPDSTLSSPLTRYAHRSCFSIQN